jgi:hypothetical protein
MIGAADERSKDGAQRSDPRILLVVFLTTVAVGAGLIVSLRGTPAHWCEFTEFGYLSRIPAALALVAEVGLAVLLALGGLVWALLARLPRLPFVIAAGLLSAVAISFVIPEPDCQAYQASLPPAPQPTRQHAALRLAFGDPFPGQRPYGDAWCNRENRGEDVFTVSTDTNVARNETKWRFHGELDTFVDFSVYPDGDKYFAPASHLWLRLLVAPELGRDAISVYTEDSGGTVVIDAAPDGASGTLTFTNLALRDSPVGGGVSLPQTVSGEITWTCSGEEEN